MILETDCVDTRSARRSAKEAGWLHRHRAAITIFLIAVGARVVYAWILLPYAAAAAGFTPSPGRDGYWQLARCLLMGKGYRFHQDLGETMFRLPGYPMFLCGTWWLFGVKLWVVQFIQSVIGGCTALLVFKMGKRYFSSMVGLLAGLAFALWPIDWVVCSHYVTEPLYLLLLTGGMVVLLRLVESPKIRLALVLGVIMGVASLVREVNVFLLPALAIGIPCLPLARKKRPKCFLTLMVAIPVAALLMFPWVARGYRLTGSMILPTTGKGFTLYAVTSWMRHEDYPGNLKERMTNRVGPDMVRFLASHGIKENSGDWRSSYWWTFMSIEDEFRADQILRQKAIEEIQDDRIQYVRFFLGNVLHFWFRGPTEEMTWLARLLLAPLLLLGAIGFVAAARSGQRVAWALLLFIAYFNLFGAVAIASFRYTLPAMPALLVLAARGVSVFIPMSPRTPTPARNSSGSVTHDDGSTLFQA